jgi:hypothetical protein
MLTSLGTPGRSQLISKMSPTKATAATIAMARLYSDKRSTSFQ